MEGPPLRPAGERESRCRGLQPATQPGAVPKLRPQRRREPRPRSTPEGEFRPPCRRETRPSSVGVVLNEGRGRGAVARGDRDPVKGQSEADIFS